MGPPSTSHSTGAKQLQGSEPPKVGQWHSASHTLQTNAQHNRYVHFINLELLFSVMPQQSPSLDGLEGIPFPSVSLVPPKDTNDLSP